MVVPGWDVKKGAAAGGEEPSGWWSVVRGMCLREKKKERRGIGEDDSLMTIRDEKVRIQLPQIKRDLSHPMRAIDAAQDPKTSTLLRKPLKRKPDTRQSTDGLKHRHFGPQPLPLEPFHHLNKPLHNLLMLTRKLIPLHLPRLHIPIRLHDRHDRILARTVDGVEVDDHVSPLVDEVPQHRVDAQRGVLDEDAGFGRCVEEVGDGGARGQQVFCVLVAHEFVGGGFGKVLEAAERGLHGFGVGAVGACLRV